jgi:acyl-CoA thioesterase-1
MPGDLVSRRAALLGVAAAAMIALTPAAARTAARITVSALPTSPSATASAGTALAEALRLDAPLLRVARDLAASRPVKIVALGSSSTYGDGASTPAMSYPSRLAEELPRLLPGHAISVLNRGVNGDDTPGMLARLARDVLAEEPDLVLWQAVTNGLMGDRPVADEAALLREGLARLKASGADVVLIDPQFAPAVIAKPAAQEMVAMIAAVAKAEQVGLFRRFALMRHWHEAEHVPFATFVSADGLHMNDWSYRRLARALGAAIAEAATRPLTTVARAGARS